MTILSQLIAGGLSGAGLDVPAHWRQGRTAYGGLSAALALASAEQALGEGAPPLRAGQVAFVGPAVEALRCEANVLRQGKSASFVSADVLSGEGLALRALFLFGAARESRIAHEFGAAPQVPPPAALMALPQTPLAPAFLANFDVRFAGNAFPVSGAAEPDMLAWVKHRDVSGVSPAVGLVALADCIPPAAMATFKAPAPISSVTWSFDIKQAVAPDQWFLIRTTALRSQDGYSYQTMGIWAEDGTPVIAASQTVAIFA